MQNHTPDRLEIFLALALKSGARQNSTAVSFMPSADDFSALDAEAADDSEDVASDFFAAICAHLTEKEAANFERLQTIYRDKTAIEKAVWQAEILRKIGTDEPFIDAAIHWSYVGAALRKEIPAVRRIVFDSLSSNHRQAINAAAIESSENDLPKTRALEKVVRRAFARQFVALRDLPKPTAFDCLNAAQLARLIRSIGIREVALACRQIEAVESVAAFLRLFSAEDAQAIAAWFNNAAKMSDERLAFAENLVHTTLENESKPSAMLDLLGVRLIGVLLCGCPKNRVVYTGQKLPLEVAPQLKEIIEEQCLHTPPNLLREIGAEVERVAQTIYCRADERESADES